LAQLRVGHAEALTLRGAQNANLAFVSIVMQLVRCLAYLF
jgi:hypothetical protein